MDSARIVKPSIYFATMATVTSPASVQVEEPLTDQKHGEPCRIHGQTITKLFSKNRVRTSLLGGRGGYILGVDASSFGELEGFAVS